MLNAMHRLLSGQPQFRIGLFSFLLIATLGAIDLATGYELSFSIFYTIPVGIGTWYVGRRFGLAVCTVSAIVWFTADIGHSYSHSSIPFWNASVRLGFFVIIALLLDRLRQALCSQELLAQQDPLTSLMNARAFKQRCHWVFSLASRNSRPVALGFLDLDGFKGINDSLGHSGGDEVLKAVAIELTKRLRASDICGRLGGDEFAVLLPETDLAGARTYFAGLRECLVLLAMRNHWAVGFSIGVAVFPSSIMDPDDAIRVADSLMYKVKNSGKNGILFEEYAGVTRAA